MSEEYTLSTVFSLPHVTFNDRRELPAVDGVYFVAEPESTALFYIGKAQSLRNRWGAHHRATQMQPHYHIYWMECDEESERIELESKLIGAFTPAWNASRVDSTAMVGKSLVYRQTLNEELAAKVEATRRTLGLSVQEMTTFALALFCQQH